ncbi:MAG TPA: serine hydrolase domain-containing protein [Streptosporangiaceae bacterium]
MTELLAAEGLERFDEIAAGLVRGETVPGLVAVAARGDQVHAQAAGSLSYGGPPVRRDSIFRIASVTKPITAVATLALAAEGLLRLDEPVDRLLPELADRRVLRRIDGPLTDTVPASRAITVRDLLTFTMGFGDAMELFEAPEPPPVVRANNELRLFTIGPPHPDQQPDPDTWIAALGSLPLLAQPGERWLYNTGASVLGVLLARAAGQPFSEVMRSRIFEPLGMRDTGFWTSQSHRLGTAYRTGDAGAAEAWDEPAGFWSRPHPFEDGAGGLVSTADDLLAFSRMLLRGGSPVLAQPGVAEMTRDQLTAGQKARGGLYPGFFDGQGWGYCLAVITDGPQAGAYGWAGGFGTTWIVDPALDLTVVVLTQRMFDSSVTPQSHVALQSAAYSAAGVALP